MTTFNFTFILSLWRWLRFSFPLSSSNTFSTTAFKAFYSPILQWPVIWHFMWMRTTRNSLNILKSCLVWWALIYLSISQCLTDDKTQEWPCIYTHTSVCPHYLSYFCNVWPIYLDNWNQLCNYHHQMIPSVCQRCFLFNFIINVRGLWLWWWDSMGRHGNDVCSSSCVRFDYCDPKTQRQFFLSIFIDIYAKKISITM